MLWIPVIRLAALPLAEFVRTLSARISPYSSFLSLPAAPILIVFSLRAAPRHADVSCEVHQLSLGANSSTTRPSDSLRLLGLPARSQLGPSLSAPSQLAWIHICRATAIRTSCKRSLNLPFTSLRIPFAHVYLISRSMSCPLAQRYSSPRSHLLPLPPSSSHLRPQVQAPNALHSVTWNTIHPSCPAHCRHRNRTRTTTSSCHVLLCRPLDGPEACALIGDPGLYFGEVWSVAC